MPSPNLQSEQIRNLLQLILPNAGLNLDYTLRTGDEVPTPVLHVTFRGPDVNHLLARNAELLLALEHVAAKTLRLEPEEHDLISFDAASFKADRQRTLERSARAAIAEVRRTGQPHHFAPMNSRERRLLHLALSPFGLRTQSEGEGPQRHLVLHPKADRATVQLLHHAHPARPLCEE